MNVSNASVGRVKIRYYVVPRGRKVGYWRPTKAMQAAGFRDVCCGPDGPRAWAEAERWNAKWDAHRRGLPAPTERTEPETREQAEAGKAYPAGTVGDAWQRYIRTKEWASKAEGTRQKIWWPAWYRIRDVWGDIDPNTITFEMMSEWRSALVETKGLDVAHKTLKVWRALWVVMQGMRIAHGTDPSSGVRNTSPAPRHQRWSEGEAVRLVKAAWRDGNRGLACIVAVCWDTLFSPVDVRTLAARHLVRIDGRLAFDRSEEGRAKTGRAAFGTLSRRTERLVLAYLEAQAVERMADTILFRTMSGAAYRPDMLGHDFAKLRERVFPGDKRQLRDMRRAGTVEMVAGGPESGAMSAKLANSIERSNTLWLTYAPVDVERVLTADEARQRGRKRIRSGTNRVEKLHTDSPNVQLPKVRPRLK